jgi:tape measure domain-containing protein
MAPVPTGSVRGNFFKGKKMSGVIIDVKTDSDKARRDLEQIKGTLDGIKKSSESTASTLKNFAASLVGLASAGVGVGFLVKVNNEFTNLSNRIALVTGRTKELVIVQEALLNTAIETRSAIGGTATIFSTLGKSLKDSQKNMSMMLLATSTIQKSIALSGGSIESANAAIIQLGQGLSAGALRGEELNSVMEQTPRLAQALADSLNVNIGGLRAAALAGKLTTDVVYKGILSQSEKINKEFASLDPTLSQGFQQASTSLSIFINELDKGLGISENLGRALGASAVKLRGASVEIRATSALFASHVREFLDGAAIIGAPILSILKTIGIQIREALPQGFFTRTVIGDMKEGLRQIDDATGGIFSSLSNLARFGLTDLISWDSDVEKALKTLKRLSPSNWATGGFDSQTIKRFFSIDTLHKYGDAFSALAAALHENSTGFWPNFAIVMRKVGYTFLDAARYVGLLRDTLFTLRVGNIDSMIYSMAEMLRGVTGVQLKVYELGHLLREVFGPTTNRLKIAMSDVFKALPGMIGNTLVTIADLVKRAIPGIVAILESFFQIDIPDMPVIKFDVDFKGFLQKVEDQFNKLKDIASKAFAKIKLPSFAISANMGFDTITAMLNKLLTSLKGLGIVEKAKGYFHGVAKAIDNFIGSVQKALTPMSALERLQRNVGTVVMRLEGAILSTLGLLMAFQVVFPGIGTAAVMAASALGVFYTALGIAVAPERNYKAIDKIIALFDKVKEMAMVKLAEALRVIKKWSNAVIQEFATIYDKVIGHSWWTDTMDGVVDQAKGLPARLAEPFKKFKELVKNTFSQKVGLGVATDSLKNMGANALHFRVSTVDLTSRVSDAFSAVATKFPETLRTVLVAIGGLLVAAIFPISAIRSHLLLLIAGSLLAGAVLIAEKFSVALVGGSFSEKLGRAMGESVGYFVGSFIREIPQILNSLTIMTGAFVQGFLDQMPVISGAISAIFSVASAFGLAGPLGLVGLYFFGGAIGPLMLQFKATKSFAEHIGKFHTWITGLGASSGIIGKYLFGPLGMASVFGGIGLLFTALGSFDSLLGNSLILKMALEGGLLYLFIFGSSGVASLKNQIIVVSAPVFMFIKEVMKELTGGKGLLYNMLYGVAGSTQGNLAKTAIEVFDSTYKAISKFVDSLVKKGTNIAVQMFFGGDEAKAVAALQKAFDSAKRVVVSAMTSIGEFILRNNFMKKMWEGDGGDLVGLRTRVAEVKNAFRMRGAQQATPSQQQGARASSTPYLATAIGTTAFASNAVNSAGLDAIQGSADKISEKTKKAMEDIAKSSTYTSKVIVAEIASGAIAATNSFTVQSSMITRAQFDAMNGMVGVTKTSSGVMVGEIAKVSTAIAAGSAYAVSNVAAASAAVTTIVTTSAAKASIAVGGAVGPLGLLGKMIFGNLGLIGKTVLAGLGIAAIGSVLISIRQEADRTADGSMSAFDTLMSTFFDYAKENPLKVMFTTAGIAAIAATVAFGGFRTAMIAVTTSGAFMAFTTMFGAFKLGPMLAAQAMLVRWIPILTVVGKMAGFGAITAGIAALTGASSEAQLWIGGLTAALTGFFQLAIANNIMFATMASGMVAAIRKGVIAIVGWFLSFAITAESAATAATRFWVALTGPIGWIIAGITAIGAIIVTSMGEGNTVLEKFEDTWGRILVKVGAVAGGMTTVQRKLKNLIPSDEEIRKIGLKPDDLNPKNIDFNKVTPALKESIFKQAGRVDELRKKRDDERNDKGVETEATRKELIIAMKDLAATMARGEAATGKDFFKDTKNLNQFNQGDRSGWYTEAGDVTTGLALNQASKFRLSVLQKRQRNAPNDKVAQSELDKFKASLETEFKVGYQKSDPQTAALQDITKYFDSSVNLRGKETDIAAVKKRAQDDFNNWARSSLELTQEKLINSAAGTKGDAAEKRLTEIRSRYAEMFKLSARALADLTILSDKVNKFDTEMTTLETTAEKVKLTFDEPMFLGTNADLVDLKKNIASTEDLYDKLINKTYDAATRTSAFLQKRDKDANTKLDKTQAADNVSYNPYALLQKTAERAGFKAIDINFAGDMPIQAKLNVNRSLQELERAKLELSSAKFTIDPNAMPDVKKAFAEKLDAAIALVVQRAKLIRETIQEALKTGDEMGDRRVLQAKGITLPEGLEANASTSTRNRFSKIAQDKADIDAKLLESVTGISREDPTLKVPNPYGGDAAAQTRDYQKSYALGRQLTQWINPRILNLTQQLSDLSAIGANFNLATLLSLPDSVRTNLTKASDEVARIQVELGKDYSQKNKGLLVAAAESMSKAAYKAIDATLSQVQDSAVQMIQWLNDAGVQMDIGKLFSLPTEVLDSYRKGGAEIAKLKAYMEQARKDNKQGQVDAYAKEIYWQTYDLSRVGDKTNNIAKISETLDVQFGSDFKLALSEFNAMPAALKDTLYKDALAQRDDIQALKDGFKVAFVDNNDGAPRRALVDLTPEEKAATEARIEARKVNLGRDISGFRTNGSEYLDMFRGLGAKIDGAELIRPGMEAIFEDIAAQMKNADTVMKNPAIEKSVRIAAAETRVLLDEKLAEILTLATMKRTDTQAYRAGQNMMQQMRDSISTGIKDFAKGKTTFKGFLTSVMDTLTSSIIDTFVDGMMSAVTKKGGLFSNLFGSLGESLFGKAAGLFGGNNEKDYQVLAMNELTVAIQQLTSALGFGGGTDLSLNTPNQALKGEANGGVIQLGDNQDPTAFDPVSGQKKVGMSANAGLETMKSGFSQLGDVFVNANMTMTERLSGGLAGLGSIFGGGLSALLGGLGGMFQGLLGMFSGGGSKDGWGQFFSIAKIATSFFGGGVGGSSAGTGAMVWDGGGYASGGFVKGLGSSLSDSIPAMLSNGEFVVNAKSTQRYAHLLGQINNGSLAHYAMGGIAGTPAFTTGRNDFVAMKDIMASRAPAKEQQVFNINITGDVSRQTRSEIQKMIPNIATGVNRHNYENNIRQ